jgi:uncharacterized protein (TIGR02265 family)
MRSQSLHGQLLPRGLGVRTLGGINGQVHSAALIPELGVLSPRMSAPMDPSLEPVVFGSAIEGMRKALGKKFTPALRDQLNAVGVDFEKVQVAYSLASWLEVIRVLARTLGAEVPEADRFRHLGRMFMRGFVETPMGFAALTAGKVFGTRRTLLRMGRNFRTAANYIETENTELGPKELRIRTWINPKFLPRIADRSMLIADYRRGVLEEVIALLGSTGTVEFVDVNPDVHDITFHITLD